MAIQYYFVMDEDGGHYESYDDGVGDSFSVPAEGYIGSSITSYDPSSAAETQILASEDVKEIPNPAAPGQTGYGWKYYNNGTAISPDGKYYFDGKLTYDPADTKSSFSNLISRLGDYAKTPKGIASLLGTAAMLGTSQTPKTGGWQGTIPKLTAVRQAIEQPEYKPYSGQAVMGRRMFTTPKFVASASPEAVSAAQAADLVEAQDLFKSAKPAPAAATAPVTQPVTAQPLPVPQGYMMNEFNQLVAQPKPVEKASGGIAALAKGRYLAGPTDGMADEIPSSIDDKQPAKLSHGEFVIPADVVSHLGNGNSEAGANVLYKMMDKVRKARTGTTKQGKEINPEKFTPGGIAKFANGGAVAFQTGGTTGYGTGVTANAPYGTTTTTSLAPWVGDYVSDYLSRGMALSKEPYQAYQGPLTAGTSPIQQQAFNLAGSLGQGFDANAINQYMNPYIQMALAPQLSEQRRQADITQQALQGQFTRAGAFGGSREALARTENMRNLADLQARTIGQGYQTAYDRALGQYNLGRQQQLADLSALLGLGKTQRDIEQEGITAQKAQFEAEREDPFKKAQFAGSLLSGLPTGTTSTTPNTTALSQLGMTGDQWAKLMDIINKWGATDSAPGTSATSGTNAAATTPKA